MQVQKRDFSKNIFTDRSKVVLPLWIVFVVNVLCFFMLSRLFIAALWSPAGKGLTSWRLFVMFNYVFVTFPCGILGQGVVLDCIDSLSLPPFLL